MFHVRSPMVPRIVTLIGTRNERESHVHQIELNSVNILHSLQLFELLLS